MNLTRITASVAIAAVIFLVSSWTGMSSRMQSAALQPYADTTSTPDPGTLGAQLTVGVVWLDPAEGEAPLPDPSKQVSLEKILS